MLQLRDGRFIDYRWKEGRWVLSEFANKQTGEMDWPAWNSVRAAWRESTVVLPVFSFLERTRPSKRLLQPFYCRRH